MKNKVVPIIYAKARRNLKHVNELIEGQKKALNLFKNFRKMALPHKVPLMREIIGTPKEVTGRAGSKMLRELKKHRKGSAWAIRATQGRTYPKAKWHSHAIKKLKEHDLLTKKMIPHWKKAKVPKDVIVRELKKNSLYQEAKRRLIDRQINARAKGITFRRINGRIVPIRIKK